MLSQSSVVPFTASTLPELSEFSGVWNGSFVVCFGGLALNGLTSAVFTADPSAAGAAQVQKSPCTRIPDAWDTEKRQERDLIQKGPIRYVFDCMLHHVCTGASPCCSTVPGGLARLSFSCADLLDEDHHLRDAHVRIWPRV